MADYNRDDRSTGALFKAKVRKNDKSPALRGELTLTKALLKELIEEAKVGNPIKLSISAWNNTSKAGNQYISLSAQKYVEYKKEEADEETPF
jgi:hypothetical protein